MVSIDNGSFFFLQKRYMYFEALTLFHSLRCWRDNKTTLGQNLVHSGYSPNAGRIMCFSGALQSHLFSIESLPSGGVYTLRNHNPSYGEDVSLIA